MKKILSLALVLALTAAMFTACGCMDQNISTHPGGMITESTTEPAILPTPTATHETRPTETTRPHATAPTGNGTEATGENSMPTDTTMAPRHGTGAR